MGPLQSPVSIRVHTHYTITLQRTIPREKCSVGIATDSRKGTVVYTDISLKAIIERKKV